MSALHVAFTRELSGRLRDAAAARGLTPQVLVAGALACMLDRELLDSVFLRTDPHDAAGGQAKHPNGLTHLQCAILFLVGQHAGRDGTCHLSTNSFAYLIGGASQTAVQASLLRLVNARLLRRETKRFAGGVQPYSLTAGGAKIAAQLSGEMPNGWVEEAK